MRAAPAVSRAMGRRKRTRAYRFSGGTPTFPAQWSYGLYRALPGRAGLVVTVAREKLLLTDLTPASGRHDHTTSPYASAPFVKGTSASTASRPALVTIAKCPSYRDGTKAVYW